MGAEWVVTMSCDWRILGISSLAATGLGHPREKEMGTKLCAPRLWPRMLGLSAEWIDGWMARGWVGGWGWTSR